MKTPPPKTAFGDMVHLDVRHAWKTMGGKTVEEAYQDFKVAAFPQIENFLWMAPEAFVYYFPIVVRYVTSGDAKGDSDTISCAAGILESQLDQHRQGLSVIFGDILALSKHVTSHYADYDVNEDVYGDLRSRYDRIASLVERLTCT